MFKKFACIFLAIAAGCAQEVPTADLRGDQFFPPPVQGDALPPRWIIVTRFTVIGQSAYDANIEVAVKGVYDSTGAVQCELIQSHPRFRQDRGWSPLPLAFYSVNYKTEDGLEDLNELFRLTLDFTEKILGSEISFLSTFRRGKVLQSRWKIFPRKHIESGQEACTAFAAIEKNSQVSCKTDQCVIRDVIVEVDTWRHIMEKIKPNAWERDDISSLTLNLENLTTEGYPEGGEYAVRVPEFQ